MTDRTDETVMYRTHSWRFEIETLKVTKQTAHFVTYIGSSGHELRERKDDRWFDTWANARTALLEKAERNLRHAEHVMQQARSNLGLVQSMRESA